MANDVPYGIPATSRRCRRGMGRVPDVEVVGEVVVFGDVEGVGDVVDVGDQGLKYCKRIERIWGCGPFERF